MLQTFQQHNQPCVKFDSIAFRIFKEMCEDKYGKEGAKERIVATTDKARGALKTLATEEFLVLAIFSWQRLMVQIH